MTGPRAPITVVRDAYGIAHVEADSEHDAWFGQGYVSAQDRLWQMEYDRRRAVGRWAEAAGRTALAGDVLARKLQLERSARADVEAMSAETRAMFEAYAAGVNALLASEQPLPPEYALTGLSPEPWEAWHSVAVYKVRHAAMGTWPAKLARAALLAKIGPEAYAKLDERESLGSPTILPPGGEVTRLLERGLDDLRDAAQYLGFLAEATAGSNSWAVHGSRTTTGMPVLCNDSHRQLDVPNVYWQVHLACPAFNAVGATFPGVPGFPHFGHNGSVAWNITHACGDYQDLYVERFDPERPGWYRTPDGWAQAERAAETIACRDARPEEIVVWRTRHGPVVHGAPEGGWGLALRYTATDRPNRGFEVFRRMLSARTVEELQEAQRGWVDPANNLVAADTRGTIGYLTRGEIPVRASKAGRLLPVPGWTGEHEWVGTVPFERMPRSINPREGYVATANQRIVDGDDPYIGASYSVPSRAERLVELLSGDARLSPEQVMGMQADTTSVPARAWAQFLAKSGPFAGAAEDARAMLAAWDGNLLPRSGPALLYSCFRRAVAQELFQPIVGKDVWAWLVSRAMTGTQGLVEHWLYNAVAHLDARTRAPDGRDWPSVVAPALAAAWERAVQLAGADPDAWRWAGVHGTNPKHTLSATFPEHAAALDPPRVSLGGDSDTLQRAGYALGTGSPFDLVDTSVYRQAVDLARIEDASSAIPGGISGVPGAAHAADQLARWRAHERVPMPYTREAVRAGASSTELVTPASR